MWNAQPPPLSENGFAQNGQICFLMARILLWMSTIAHWGASPARRRERRGGSGYTDFTMPQYPRARMSSTCKGTYTFAPAGSIFDVM